MSVFYSFGQLLILALAAFLLFVAPIWLFVSGIRRLANRRGGTIRVVVGAVWAMFTLFALDSMFGPWHERILDTGTTPDGRDYVLIQRFNEPFGVELYVRSPDVGWVFYYIDHEVFPWRCGGDVEFSDGTASVFRGREIYKTVDLLPLGEADSHQVYPASLSPEDLFKELTNRH